MLSYFVKRILVDGDNLVQIGRLDGDEGGHNLGRACHWHWLLAAQVIEHMPRIIVH